jgi:hypothetical protein
MGNQNAANRVGAGQIEEVGSSTASTLLPAGHNLLAAFQFLPAHYSWPKGLRVDKLHILLAENVAVAVINGAQLEPYIPLNHLAQFLNEHVQGAVRQLTFSDSGEGLEDGVLRLLNKVTVPGRLHTEALIFDDFFHLPWAGIERIFDGWALRAITIGFNRLQLPSGVDADELFKLPTVRECSRLSINSTLPQLPGPPPLFKNAALMEWLEQSDVRHLVLSSDCLSSGPLSFLDALKEVGLPPGSSPRLLAIVMPLLLQNFQPATQVHPYVVEIRCPSINGVTGLGVREEKLFNRLGEKMLIKVVVDPAAIKTAEQPFEELRVTRVHLS